MMERPNVEMIRGPGELLVTFAILGALIYAGWWAVDTVRSMAQDRLAQAVR